MTPRSPIIFTIFLQAVLSQIAVRDFGLANYEEGDMGLIIFVTIENTSDKNYEISVRMLDCEETQNGGRSIFLLGGNMGILYKKYIRNVTLIYPNMFFWGLTVDCTISITYTSDEKIGEFKTEINFSTRPMVVNAGNDSLQKPANCATEDLDIANDCNPVDCLMKYSGERSYFNKMTRLCEPVPVCIATVKSPDIMYQILNNRCKTTKSYICKADLQKLHNSPVSSTCNCEFFVNSICHHGILDNETGCECLPEWITSPDTDAYQPSLQQYHLCNIEINAWNSVNRSKIKTTILLICIFAITIASKLVILMCVISWLIKWLARPFDKNSRSNKEEEDFTCICKPEDAMVLDEAEIERALSECRTECKMECNTSGKKPATITVMDMESKSKKGSSLGSSGGKSTCVCRLESCICSLTKKPSSIISRVSSKTSSKSKSSVQVYMFPTNKSDFEDKHIDIKEVDDEQADDEDEDEEEEEEEEDYEIEFSEEQTEQEDQDHVPLSQIKEDDENA